jgi:hypothetical protein
VTVYVRLAGEKAAESRLAAVLESKPPTDQVSLAAWWFVTSSLESSVQVRRALEGIEPRTRVAVHLAVLRAQQSARAALEELPANLGASPSEPARATEPMPLLRRTIRSLALLVVTPRVTTAAQLSAALHWHIETLEACRSRV